MVSIESAEITLSPEQLNPVRKLVAKGGASIASIVRAASGIVRPVAVRVLERTVILPTPITLNVPERAALHSLEKHLSAVVWPTERRLLSEDEKKDLLTLLNTVKDAKAVIDRTEKSLSAAFGNHLDIQAEAANGTPTAVIDDTTEISEKSGQYVLPGKVSHPEIDIVASREVRAGSTTLDDEDLRMLEETGVIDHATYLSWTEQARVPNEYAILASIAKNPWLSIALARGTRRGAGGTSLYRRKSS